MNIASLILHPFELELKTKISQGMISEALTVMELPAPFRKVAVECLDSTLRVHIETTLSIFKNLSVDARIVGIQLSKEKSTVHCELMGKTGIFIKFVSMIISKFHQFSINGNKLDIDITDVLLKRIPEYAASLLDEAQVHVLNLEPGFLNLGIRKR